MSRIAILLFDALLIAFVTALPVTTSQFQDLRRIARAAAPESARLKCGYYSYDNDFGDGFGRHNGFRKCYHDCESSGGGCRGFKRGTRKPRLASDKTII